MTSQKHDYARPLAQNLHWSMKHRQVDLFNKQKWTCD